MSNAMTIEARDLESRASYESNVITTINLCNVPLTPINQLLFESESKQQSYFLSRRVRQITGCRYPARRGTMDVKGYVEDVSRCNYGYYVTTYNGVTKYYYFWIVQKAYKAKDVTTLTIQLDVIQTWMFTAIHNPCFVERMHVDSDLPGENEYPEDFELGDYVCYHKIPVRELTGRMGFILASSENLQGLENVQCVYNGVYSGVTLLYFGPDEVSRLNTFIQNRMEQGLGDTISYIFTFPENLMKYYKTGNLGIITKTNTQAIEVQGVDKYPDVIYDKDGYERSYRPKNKKLLGYPYKAINITAANGNNILLKPQLFKAGEQSHMFKLTWTMGQNPEFMLYPINYAGKDESLEDAIELNGFPLCSWNNDNYAVWYAQNSNKIKTGFNNSDIGYNANAKIANNNYLNAMRNRNANKDIGVVNTAASTIGNLLSLNFAGAISSGVTGGLNTYAQYEQAGRNAVNDLQNSSIQNDASYQQTIASMTASLKDAQVMPNTCKGDTSASGLDASMGLNTFFIEYINIKPDFAKVIDDYCTMYGYKKMRLVRDPVMWINTRKHWNYIKTVNDTCIGMLPQEDCDEISRIFNNGITFWHNPDTFMDYTQDNFIWRTVDNGYVNNSGTGSGEIVDPTG